MGNHRDKSDAENIREILDAVGDRVPRMVKGIMSSIYTPEAGASMGQAVGAYYKELIAAGLPQDAALQMTRDFSLNMKNMMGNMGGMGGGEGRGHRHGGGQGPRGFNFTWEERDDDNDDDDDEDEEHADEDEDEDHG